MLRVNSAACAALVLALVVPATVSAQYGDTGESKKPTINIFGTFGSASVMRDLDANASRAATPWAAAWALRSTRTSGSA